MTNLERIKNMNLDELARLLTYETIIEEVDYDWDEEPYSNILTAFIGPDKYVSQWEEDVLEHTRQWLMEKVDGEKD